LTFLDITASSDKRDIVAGLVRQVADQVFIPFTVGGGLRSLEDVRAVLRSGADKVSLNTAAIQTPDLIKAGAETFGSQCMVVAVDARRRMPAIQRKVGRFTRTAAGSGPALMRSNGFCALRNLERERFSLPAWIATAPKMDTTLSSPELSPRVFAFP
jgi:imidazole glycerol phosphate synthase subunit HisF